MTPVYSLESEREILAAMMAKPDEVCDEIPNLVLKDDFFHAAHQVLFDAVLELWATEGSSFDMILIHEKAKSIAGSEIVTIGALAEILASSSTYHTFRSHCGRVKKLSSLRRLQALMLETGERIQNGDLDADKIITQAEQEITELTTQEVVFENKVIGADIKEFAQKVISWSDGIKPLEGIPTGFPSLDGMTSGFKAGEMIVIAARPGVGKSALMLSMIRNMVMQGFPIQCFSLEMTRQQLQTRLLSAHSNVPMQSMIKGKLGDFEKASVEDHANKIASWKLFIDEQAGLDIAQIRARARRSVRRNGVKAIFIDYLQLLHSKKYRNRHEEVAHISVSLKTMAKELNVPVIALAQLNRTAADDRPSLHHLRESGAIEQDADVVFLLHQHKVAEEYEKMPNSSLSYAALSIIIAKQRQGPTGEVPIRFYGWKTAFEEEKK